MVKMMVPKIVTGEEAEARLDTHTFLWLDASPEQLPLHHHDPFDRLLIAQAKAEQMQLVSADSQFEPYLVVVIW
jgi:PIN domain nuclease of toxin-antitoxin system